MAQGHTACYQSDSATSGGATHRHHFCLATNHDLPRQLGEAKQQVRDLAHSIMPVQIDDEGLQSALHELVESTNSERIDCRFECSGDFKKLDKEPLCKFCG